MAPPRWKAMVASGLALYPLVLFIPDLLKRVTGPLPTPLEALTTVCVITPLATFVMLPTVNRLLRGWLYRGEPKA